MEENKVDYVFIIKKNRSTLFEGIQSLDPDSFPPPVQTVDKGHNRIEIRTIRVSTALNEFHCPHFPYAAQVFRLERQVMDLQEQIRSQETVYGVTVSVKL